MAMAKSKSTIPLLMKTSLLLVVSCSSVIVQTPQEMSDHVISVVKVDPQTDPNPKSLVSDQAACANQARREYPIGGVTHQSIIKTTFLLYFATAAGMTAACDATGAVWIIGRWRPFG